MRAGRNRLFNLNKKYFKIAVAAVVVVIAIVIIALIASANKKAAEKQSAVDAVAKAGVFNIGLRGDIGTLCLYDEQTKTYTGLEKDIADELAKRLFSDGGVIINFVSVNSETKDSMLQQEKLDISLGASVKGSASGINYSQVYFSDACAFLVREGEMTSEDGLNGGKIAVIQGTYPATKQKDNKNLTYLDEYLSQSGIQAFVKIYASYPEAIEALKDGFVSAVCANEINLKLFGKAGMLILPERFMPISYCVQVRGTLGVFIDVVNDCLSEMKNDGTISALLEKYELVDYSELID
ncbi:MAG: transporter substrate-binding domain-containing protein [Burkholderiales bacterium]